MEKFLKNQIWLAFGAITMALIISFGFGYFFGRYEQIQINKTLLQAIPDVNCGRVGGV